MGGNGGGMGGGEKEVSGGVSGREGIRRGKGGSGRG